MGCSQVNVCPPGLRHLLLTLLPIIPLLHSTLKTPRIIPVVKARQNTLSQLHKLLLKHVTGKSSKCSKWVLKVWFPNPLAPDTCQLGTLTCRNNQHECKYLNRRVFSYSKLNTEYHFFPLVLVYRSNRFAGNTTRWVGSVLDNSRSKAIYSVLS